MFSRKHSSVRHITGLELQVFREKKLKDLQSESALFSYESSKKHAEKSRLPFNISFEDYKEISILPCQFCKTIKFGNAANPMRLTRYALGYIKENVSSCCWDCKRMAGKLSAEEFLVLVKIIANANV